jgi:hypothetical protein
MARSLCRPRPSPPTPERNEASRGSWIVDPEARTLEALRLDPESGAWIEVGAYDDESVARVAPFEAIELEVGRLFLPRAREV